MRLSLVLLFVLYFPSALPFSVTVGSSPTQCGPLNVTWSGGEAPFQISLIPVYAVPRNISIPSTAFNNNRGSYQISSIPFLEGSQFLLTMSDATGFGTGGTSALLTVGAAVGGASCNTSNPQLAFSFSLPSSLQQCGPYTFDDYGGATLPITIAGLIPSGDSFLLHPPSGTSFTWTADVAAGTTIVFTVTDANGVSGGSSDTEIVALSSDASCLNANSPSSTGSSFPSSTLASSPTSSPVRSTSAVSTGTKSAVSAGTIAGAAVGAVLAITGVVALAVFYLKRQRYKHSPFRLAPTQSPHRPTSIELDPGIDNFQHPPIYPFPYQTDSASHLAPPVASDSSAAPASYRETLRSVDPLVHVSERPYSHPQSSRANSTTNSFAASGDVASSSMSSSGRRKAAMAGLASRQPATRFIVHTDAEDHFPADEVEVVELPPQYSERRTPVTRHMGEGPMASVTRLSSATGQQDVDESPQSTSRPLE